MANFELSLEGFTFPPGLPEKRSTFRFFVDLRYIDPEGKFVTSHSILPGLDTYWECEKEKHKEASYVRHAKEPRIDMDKIDLWDKLIVVVRAKELHSIQVRVFDIEKTGGFLDKLKDYAGMIVEAFVGKATRAVTTAVPTPPDFAENAFGAAVHDVEAFALTQLAGIKQQDSLIFKRSRRGLAPDSNGFELKGNGTEGEYVVKIKVAEV